jgi:hypothetical protein
MPSPDDAAATPQATLSSQRSTFRPSTSIDKMPSGRRPESAS